MKKVLSVFALIASTTARAASELPAPEIAAMHSLHLMVISFGSWTIAGVLLGCILARAIGKKNRLLRQSLFSLSGFAGMSAGVVDQLGLFPW